MKSYKEINEQTKPDTDKVKEVETPFGTIWMDPSKSEDMYWDGKAWFGTKEYSKRLIVQSRKPKKKCSKHNWLPFGGSGRTFRGKGRKATQTHDMKCSKCDKVQMFNSNTGKPMCKR